MWSYYNFEKNWDQFLNAWNEPSIQDILFPDMNDFSISTRAMYPWKRGDPIWFLSNTDHWDLKSTQLATMKANQYGMVNNFKTSFNNATGYKFILDDAKDKFNHIVMPHLALEFYPKPNTLESLVLLGGNSAVSYSMYHIAMNMFNPTQVIYVFDDEGYQWVLIPEKQQVFDLEGYYMFYKALDQQYDVSQYTPLFQGLVELQRYWNLESESVDSNS